MSTNPLKCAQQPRDAQEDPRSFFQCDAPQTLEDALDALFRMIERARTFESHMLKTRKALAERTATATADRAKFCEVLRAVLKLLTAGESRAAIHLIRAELGQESPRRMPPDAAAAIRIAFGAKITKPECNEG